MGSTSDENKVPAGLFETIVEHLPDIVFVKDAATLRFEFYNRAGIERLGWSRDELLGRTDFDMYPKDQAEFFVARDREALSGQKTVVVEEELNSSRAGNRWYRTRKIPIPGPDGAPRFLLGISEDITETKKLKLAHARLCGVETHQAAEPGAKSPSMAEALRLADLAAEDGQSTVLLTGETGAGKGFLAQRIHARSARAEHPFLQLNCAALSPQLVESELFGHERGAFTGAVQAKAGLVEVASGGTLFLDEIAELPAPLQAQLLTFLDSRQYRRVGGTRTLESEVRIVAATNARLQRRVDEGAFRADLFYRLNVLSIHVPALRERKEDIPALGEKMLRELAQRRALSGQVLSAEVQAALAAYDWPGNVRELRNALERALILARGGPILVEHLTPEVQQALKAPPGPASAAGTLKALESQEIEEALRKTGGNRTRAAQLLGISLSTLKRRLKPGP